MQDGTPGVPSADPTAGVVTGAPIGAVPPRGDLIPTVNEYPRMGQSRIMRFSTPLTGLRETAGRHF